MSQLTATDRPHIRIRPRGSWALNASELWQYRELALAFAIRDIKIRYKQTLLGVAWVVLQPLLGAGIFTFIFGSVADMGMQGVPYFLGSFAGFQSWALFSQTISRSASSLTGHTHLISKIYFPRLILPASTTASILVDFIVAMGMLVVMMLIWHEPTSWAVLLLPVWMAAMLACGLGLGLIASALMVSFRDVRYIVPVLVQMLTWMSPVGYSLASLSERLADKPDWWLMVYQLNPLVGLIEGFRWSLFADYPAPPWGMVAYGLAVAAGVLVVGAFAFRKMERGFADVI